jgi:hypothetical protein
MKFINEVYRNSGLGKWFHDESAGGKPGWDRYNTKGERVGECGDAKKGEPYAACLSKQKAAKLGKEKIGSFVERKRAAQSEKGRGKKGSGRKGKKPINVDTGIREQYDVDKKGPSTTPGQKMDIDKRNKHFKTPPCMIDNKGVKQPEYMDKINANKSVSQILGEAKEINEMMELLEKNSPKNKKLWSRAKALARKKFDVYPCVTMDSLAITRNGPESYHNLVIGDEILSYNIQNDELEWKPILNLHHFDDAPIVEMGKATGFKIKCTPNHKWVVKSGSDYQNTGLVETKDINKHMQLVCCSELNNSSDLILENWSKKNSWTEKVLSMSKEQREIFLASAIVYDGHDQGISTKIENRHTFGFSQKNEDHFYAAILAASLNGYHVSFSDKYPEMKAATIIRNKKTHNTQNLIIEDAGTGEVWCPETENNTWVMIQNGFVTITGNSAYANAWAAKWYKKKGGSWRKLKESFADVPDDYYSKMFDSDPEHTKEMNDRIKNPDPPEELPVEKMIKKGGRFNTPKLRLEYFQNLLNNAKELNEEI